MAAWIWRTVLQAVARVTEWVRRPADDDGWLDRVRLELDRPLVGVAVGVLLIGLPLGVGASYVVWGTRVTALAGELEKTKAWLVDEIAQSDSRLKDAEEARARELGAELQQMQAALRKTQAELRQARAVAKEAAEDWRSERQRRREVETRVAAQLRDCAGAGRRTVPGP